MENGESSPIERANGYYLRVGRVVSHAALMEQWTFYLVDTLDRRALQQDHAGQHGQRLVEEARLHLEALASPLREEVAGLLNDLESVLKERNVVVHRVASQPGDSVAYAHRPLPTALRVGGDHNWIGDAFLTSDYLDEVDARVLELIERLVRIRPSRSGTAKDQFASAPHERGCLDTKVPRRPVGAHGSRQNV